MNKKISQIQYNAVSLPSEVRFGDGSYITYLYDASGRKLRADYHINPVGTLNPIVGPKPMSVGASTAGEDEASIASIPIIDPNPQIIPIRLTHTYTEYRGNHIFENGLLTMTHIPGGYISYEGGSPTAPSYHFYLCDREGNNRVVTDINGNIEQVNDFTPFGVLMKNDFTDTSNQPYKYNGKELDRMHGLDLYDYGARLYDAPLGRWHVMDLLCEKYYSWSPYAYCVNNPLSFVDPDGKKIYFANDVSEEFKRYYSQAYDYLKENNCSDILDKLSDLDGIVYLSEQSPGEASTYNHTTRTISWDPLGGFLSIEGIIFSPTTVLNHEADHALQHLTNPEQYFLDFQTSDSDFSNKEEKRVTEGSEKRTAIALGEIADESLSRKSHISQYVPVADPTATKEDFTKCNQNAIPEIIIKP